MNLSKLAQENSVDLETLKKGFETEKKEHGDTFNDFQVAQIALAHLEENKDYYEYLDEMEEEMDEIESEGSELKVTSEQMPEITTAKLGQIFSLTVKAKVKELSEEGGCLEITEINDKAFEEKDYKDLMEETSEVEEEK